MGHGWGCSSHADRRSRWQQRFAERWDRGSSKAWSHGFSSSGNAAFDEYREQTLRRLEDEQRDFREFLERLRLAKDRSEFDQFMADRKNRPPQDRKPDESDNRPGDGNRPSAQG